MELSEVKEKLKKVIMDLEDKNPYPEDIFSEPTEKEWQTMKKLFRKRGLSPEKFFGSFGRKVWSNCILTMKKELETVGLYEKEE